MNCSFVNWHNRVGSLASGTERVKSEIKLYKAKSQTPVRGPMIYDTSRENTDFIMIYSEFH